MPGIRIRIFFGIALAASLLVSQNSFGTTPSTGAGSECRRAITYRIYLPLTGNEYHPSGGLLAHLYGLRANIEQFELLGVKIQIVVSRPLTRQEEAKIEEANTPNPLFEVVTSPTPFGSEDRATLAVEAQDPREIFWQYTSSPSFLDRPPMRVILDAIKKAKEKVCSQKSVPPDGDARIDVPRSEPLGCCISVEGEQYGVMAKRSDCGQVGIDNGPVYYEFYENLTEQQCLETRGRPKFGTCCFEYTLNVCERAVFAALEESNPASCKVDSTLNSDGVPRSQIIWLNKGNTVHASECRCPSSLIDSWWQRRSGEKLNYLEK